MNRRYPILTAAATLIVSLAVCVSWVILNPPTPPATPPPTPPAVTPPPQVEGKDTPAAAAATRFTKALPQRLSGLGRVPVDAANTIYKDGCRTPVVAVTAAYAGGNWWQPSGIVITLRIYQAGMGAKAASCLNNVAAREGDMVVTIDATRATAPVAEVRRALDTAGTGCIDRTRTVDQSARNPNSKNFTGKIETFTVTGDPLPDTRRLAPQNVTIPTAPDSPHWPKSLPAQPEKPVVVEAVAKPARIATFTSRVPDRDGPGCGWVFTGMTPPVVDEAALQTEVDRQRGVVEKKLADEKTAYLERYEQWKKDAAVFTASQKVWDAWAAQVSQIGEKWRVQERRWEAYQSRLDVWQSQVAARDKFVEEKNRVQKWWDEATAACTTPTPSPAPAPSPSPSVAAPSPSPTPAPVCPPRPAILDTDPPAVGPKPEPPLVEEN